MKSLLLGLLISSVAMAAELKVGDSAPLFKAKTFANEDFDLAARKGQWTVLYFYPKSETPGCTKQACTFRDNIKAIRDQGADVFGISADDVAAQAKFHEHHKLNFTILADPDMSVIKMYGSKMPLLGMSKRWTFLLDPELKIRYIDHSVDPVKDAGKMADLLKEMKK